MLTTELNADARNIVVIGTSAGGVQALIALFENLPADLPVAIWCLIQNSSVTTPNNSDANCLNLLRTASVDSWRPSTSPERGAVYDRCCDSCA